MKQKIFSVILGFTFFMGEHVRAAEKVKIKDLTSLRGNRSNQLLGVGLIVGLPGTGDSRASLATTKALNQMMTSLGLEPTPELLSTQSVAVVAVTSDLPAFAKIGDRIDVKVSILGDAKALNGGQLLQTPLKAANGQIFAVGQGSILLGPVAVGQSPIATVATIPQGAVIEREFVPLLVRDGAIDLYLKEADITTNSRIVEQINGALRTFVAQSVDPSHIRVTVPEHYQDRVIEFLAEIENLTVTSDQRAVVVINEKTGTVVMGADVIIEDIVISHGDLSIAIGQGKDAKKDRVVGVKSATVGQLLGNLNALGMRPADLIGIVQSMHRAGAIKAELRIL